MSKEIKNKIDELNAELEKMIDPTTFVLNPQAVVIMDQINHLKRECDHNFVNGICEFCYAEER